MAESLSLCRTYRWVLAPGSTKCPANTSRLPPRRQTRRNCAEGVLRHTVGYQTFGRERVHKHGYPCLCSSAFEDRFSREDVKSWRFDDTGRTDTANQGPYRGHSPRKRTHAAGPPSLRRPPKGLHAKHSTGIATAFNSSTSKLPCLISNTMYFFNYRNRNDLDYFIATKSANDPRRP
jgi:hypothetical protein